MCHFVIESFVPPPLGCASRKAGAAALVGLSGIIVRIGLMQMTIILTVFELGINIILAF